ncbi:MAG TPA: alpha/beta hydrolase [Thermoanaerobaculia bacterium]
MTQPRSGAQEARSRIHRWIRRAFLSWAVISSLWLANSMRTRGVDESTLRTSSTVAVTDGSMALEFLPVPASREAGLVFICGSGVSAHAYAPLLRPIAEAGHPVFVVKLPYRFAPFDSHKDAAIGRARRVFETHREISRWVIAGHSLGGALAARVTRTVPRGVTGLVLIGTTHPKRDDLSSLAIPVTKIYGSNDGVAPPDRMLATKHLLPKQTRWVEIEGGNHSQFGHYGRQLFDGKATVSREAQQAIARSAILEQLRASEDASR